MHLPDRSLHPTSPSSLKLVTMVTMNYLRLLNSERGRGRESGKSVRVRLLQLTYLLKLKLFVHRYFDLSLLHLGRILVEKLCAVL